MTFDEEPTEEEIEPLAPAQGRGCRRFFNWLVGLILLLLLLALLWPVKAPKKRETPPWSPPKYTVYNPKSDILTDVSLSKFKLKRSLKGHYILVSFELKNEEAEIASLSYDKFQLIINQYRRIREVMPHQASEAMLPPEESPWGKKLLSGTTVELELLFLIPKEAKVAAFRIYEADWRSNRYKEFPL